MRKRIVIGVVAIIGVGVLGYVVLQPEPGSVEWHKREYLAAWKRSQQEDWRSRLATFLRDKTPVTPPNSLSPDEKERKLLDEKIMSHRTALRRLGYLTEKWVALSNSSDAAWDDPSPTDWPEEDSPVLVFQ